MNQGDFERLKAVCEKEGFELLNPNHEDNDKYYVIAKKKDEWEGVEYLKCTLTDCPMTGRIVRLLSFDPTSFEVSIDGKNKTVWSRFGWLPSTEQAYVDQLKKKAFFRYGEIKEGDRFDCSVFCELNINPNTIQKSFNQGFEYIKERLGDECLLFNSSIIYSNGIWAKKLPEKIEVGLKGGGMDKSSSGLISLSCKFQIYPCPTYDMSLSIISQFLAQQLEKYLNGEIKEPCTGNCGSNYCDENGCTERKRAMVDDLAQDNIRSYQKGGIR